MQDENQSTVIIHTLSVYTVYDSLAAADSYPEGFFAANAGSARRVRRAIR